MNKSDVYQMFALVTGASSGIGKEIALSLAGADYVLFINFNKSFSEAEKVRNLINKKGRKAYLVKGDVTNETDIKSIFSDISRITDHLDVLVNNAGIYIPNEIESHDSHAWDKIFATNLKAKLLCTKYSIPLLRKAQQPSIVNISSRASVKPMEESVAYCCSASGINMLTKVSALELSKYKIRVNAISPGLTKTRMTEEYDTETDFESYIKENPAQRIGTEKDIANTVLFLISEKASFINGENINVSGGILLK